MVSDKNLIHMKALMQALHDSSFRLYKISDPIHQDVMKMEMAFCNELEKTQKLYDALRQRSVAQQLMEIAEEIKHDEMFNKEKESIEDFKNNLEEVMMQMLKEKIG